MAAEDAPASIASRPAPAIQPLARPYRSYVMCVLLAISIVNYLDRQVIYILIEPIKRDLLLADWQLGLLTGLAFGLTYALFGVPIARLAERGDRPLILAISAAFWSAFTAACGLAQNFFQLVAARFAVGCGEAGSVPTSHSLIIDYVPPEKRSSALAFFGLGAPLGGLIGLAFGGLIADAYGWRMAFLIAGGPGLLLALLVAFTLKEPRRRLRGQGARARPPTASMRDMFRLVRRKRSFWLLGAAITMHVVFDVGLASFITSFYLRIHSQELTALAKASGEAFGVDLGAVGFLGVALGLMRGVGGALGAWSGGQIADRFGAADPRRYCYVPAVAMVLAAPCAIALLIVPSVVLSLVLAGLLSVITMSYYGPGMTAWFSLVAPDMRATSSAMIHLVVTLVASGLAPIAVGLMSDSLGARLGDGEGMRWALMSLVAVTLFGAWLFWRAARTFRGDAES